MLHSLNLLRIILPRSTVMTDKINIKFGNVCSTQKHGWIQIFSNAFYQSKKLQMVLIFLLLFLLVECSVYTSAHLYTNSSRRLYAWGCTRFLLFPHIIITADFWSYELSSVHLLTQTEAAGFSKSHLAQSLCPSDFFVIIIMPNTYSNKCQ